MSEITNIIENFIDDNVKYEIIVDSTFQGGHIPNSEKLAKELIQDFDKAGFEIIKKIHMKQSDTQPPIYLGFWEIAPSAHWRLYHKPSWGTRLIARIFLGWKWTDRKQDK